MDRLLGLKRDCVKHKKGTRSRCLGDGFPPEENAQLYVHTGEGD
jgi:hypothetical protein